MGSVSQVTIYTAMDPKSKTTISAPRLTGAGHTITNLARKQFEWLSKNQIPSYVQSPHPKPTTKQIIHLGNNYQSSELLLNFLENDNSKTVLILHELYLLDLFRYITSIKEHRRRFVTSIGPVKFIELLRLLNKDQEEHSLESRALNALQSLKILDKENSHIIYHCAHAQYAGIRNSFKSSQLSRFESPIGFHYFPEISKRSKGDSTLKVILSGTNSPTKKIDVIVEALRNIPNDCKTTVKVIGGIANNPAIKKLNNWNSKPYMNSDDYSWVRVHEESDVCIRIGVGMNGESSGVIRDALSLGLEVIGDEDSQILKQSKAYNFMEGSITMESLTSKLLSVKQKLTSSREVIEPDQRSLDKYFSAIMGVHL